MKGSRTRSLPFREPALSDVVERFGSLLADRYHLERELGQGGMAIVYLAEDLKHHRPVAIKALRPELAAVLGTGRFVHEIGITAQLVHPHILPLLDSGEAAGIPYYVTPYIEGQSLRDRLTNTGRLPVAEALAIAEQVATALDYAHRHGVVHRDIKPENILLHDGQALVADFGIALALASAGASRFTGTGIAIGTPAYMSPEQLTGDQNLDHRTDVYALGAVLYEMLTASTPFPATTPQAMITRRMTESVPSVTHVRRDVPPAVDRAIERAMARDPEERFDSGAAFVTACRTTRPPSGRRWLGLFAAAGVLITAAVVVPLWMRVERQRALLSLGEIQRFADQGLFPDAFNLAVRASRRLPGDTTLARLLPVVSDQLSIESDPAGASVTLQRFQPSADGRFPPPVPAGLTPVNGLRVPRGDYRVVFDRPGFVSAERIASSELLRSDDAFAPGSVIRVVVKLEPLAGIKDMVFVPGGEYQLVSPDAPPTASTALSNYYLDRREVTAAQYQEFIRGGGYSKPTLWPAPVEATERRAALVDRTKLPGPRSWNDQEFARGKGDHPVTDVSWYEASAYCAFRNKRLPTIYEWEKAARDGVTVHRVQWVVPWGVATPHDPATFRANLAGSATMPVGSFSFGLSPFGAYDMAGNVSEWTRTKAGDGYLATGGSYRDPVYLFAQYGFFAGGFAGPTLGFRCARSADAKAAPPGDPPLDIARRTPVYPVTSKARFAELRRYYDYDRHPPNGHTIGRSETPDWVNERIRFAGVGGDSVLADLFLPRGAAPPYQTIVYVPSSGAFAADPVPAEVAWLLGPHIKAGRAVFAVTMKGMIGRDWGPGHARPAPGSVQFRDEMVLHATELRLGLDYLETRHDLDLEHLAYVGLSWGAGSRLLFAALDDRFRAVVLIGGGIDERVQPTLPEANNINFAPHIRAPILLLNGRNDEEHTWLARALPLWTLLPQPKKLVLVEGAGHIPPAEARVPAINDWLNQQFGPVKH